MRHCQSGLVIESVARAFINTLLCLMLGNSRHAMVFDGHGFVFSLWHVITEQLFSYEVYGVYGVYGVIV